MTDDARAQHARGLDATFNRLAEALRTVEDRLRFDRSLASLPRRWQALRRDLADLRREVERRWGLLALWRDVASDPGTPREAREPRPHADSDAVLQANLSRARESIRSLEETLRASLPDLSTRAEQLRYTAYEVETATLGILHRRDRMRAVRLYVLVTEALASAPLLETTQSAILGGAQMIQLREKELPNRELLAVARDLRELTLELGTLLIINDRVEIAMLSEADGVHQGQEDLPPGEVRKIMGPDRIVGISTHGPDQAERAEAEGADYIGVGPIFATRTKEHRAAAGLEYIREATGLVSIPGFAIGGVNRETLPRVVAAGARRIAVCTGIIAAPDIEESARWFRTKLEEAGPPQEESCGSASS